MALVLTSGPATEPVTVAEAKAHLRIDGTAEDVLIASLILTSRLHIEAALGLALVTQSWKLLLDRWPKEHVPLPLYPAQSVASVKVYAADGTPTTIAASDYLVDTASRPGRLVPNGVGWPAPGKAAGGIEIAFTAGTARRQPTCRRRSARRCCCSSRTGTSTATPSRSERTRRSSRRRCRSCSSRTG